MLWNVSAIGPGVWADRRLDQLGKELTVHVSILTLYTYGATHSRAQ